MVKRNCLLFFLFVLVPFPLHASNQIFIFGGGPTPNESQVSIELNTRWIRDIVEREYPNQKIYLHYTDGNDVGLDMKGWSPIKGKQGQVQALARVFNSEKENGYYYYSSKLAEDVKPSDSGSISASLNALFNSSRPGDELFLVYQGHGGYRSDTNKNHFRLWDGSSINVVQFEKLMSKANSDSTIRFLFPQCFSGAFTRVIYTDARVENGIAKGRRCGFLAQREDSESEGCTDSVNTNDYHDYSSYFFSAIGGKAIDGGVLVDNPDRDNDGTVTLLEAHYYSLKNAFSVDFSRSTSQDYLEQWQPWYLRWLPIPREPDNVYSEIAEHIANRFNLNGKGKKINPEVSRKLGNLVDVIARLEKDQKELEKKISKIQKHIQRGLSKRWPSIIRPYTERFRKIMLENIEEIEINILAYPGYQELVSSQDRSVTIEKELLDNSRKLVQIKKILWMRKLARIFDQFQRYANESDKQVYEGLVQCENSAL